MKITITAIGKMKNGSMKDILQSFIKRIPWEISIKESEEKRPLPTEKLKHSEAKLLAESIPSGTKKIVLDEGGKKLTSIQFSKKLEEWKNDGQNITFVIGGADGHDESTLKQADYTLSLGEMTWPHMLTRVMLAEQIYRAYSIMENHPYHRE